jgi:hypothetical protein
LPGDRPLRAIHDRLGRIVDPDLNLAGIPGRDERGLALAR